MAISGKCNIECHSKEDMRVCVCGGVFFLVDSSNSHTRMIYPPPHISPLILQSPRRVLMN